ncbi:DUF6461 domain-containing protein [Nonomuraea terrae]|uniref:DUF6461 domain-containing protein n=1 Tax=Nonomuraea terrae TaxID=2530383 RepID=UPI00378B2C73
MDDYAWFSRERYPELADAYCFTYVRGLTPAELMTRLGVGADDCSRMTLGELTEAGFGNGMVGAGAVGDWVLMVEANGLAGITEEIIVPLSAGTRLVSQFFLEVKMLDWFYWVEDGTIRYESNNEGYSERLPDELVETMARVGPTCSSLGDLHFVLAERLTGIRLTRQLLEESTYLCGVVPGPW